MAFLSSAFPAAGSPQFQRRHTIADCAAEFFKYIESRNKIPHIAGKPYARAFIRNLIEIHNLTPVELHNFYKNVREIPLLSGDA